MTLPIGGADMPVVISIYNAFTGLAVGLEGFVLQNPALMIAGMVVGAAGMLLTLLMAKAMNRSVSNVVFTNFGDAAKAQAGRDQGQPEADRSLATPASRCAMPARSSSCRVTVSPSRRGSRSYTNSSSCCRPQASSQICDPPGGRAHARPDGCPAGRGRRALRHDLPARRHQRRFRQRPMSHWSSARTMWSIRRRATTNRRPSSACRS